MSFFLIFCLLFPSFLISSFAENSDADAIYEEGFRYYRQNIQNSDNPDGAGTDYFEWNDGEMSEVAYRQIVKEIDYENVKKWDPYSEDMKGNSYTLSEIREYLTQGGR